MRMRSYTFHLPSESRPGHAEGLDRAVLVPDGFSNRAFAFSVLWFLVNRLWLAAVIVLAGLVLVGLGGVALGVSRAGGTLIALFASVLIGLEANSLHRWTLARRGFVLRDVLTARDSAEAEAKAIARWLDETTLPPPPRPPFAGGPTKRAEPIIGLFPAREGVR